MTTTQFVRVVSTGMQLRAVEKLPVYLRQQFSDCDTDVGRDVWDCVAAH